MKWQPIETAPKDGSDVLVSCANGRRMVACWNSGLNHWVWASWSEDSLLRSLVCMPTYWSPLPDPPKTEDPCSLDNLEFEL